MSRLTSRIDVLKRRRRRPEPYTALKLLTTEDLYGWRSPEATDAALLRESLELPGASPWLVEKTAEAVVRFYAELEEHGGHPRHPGLRGAVRRLERLKEIEYVYGRPAPEKETLPRPAKTHPGRLEGDEPGHPTGGWNRSVSGGSSV